LKKIERLNRNCITTAWTSLTNQESSLQKVVTICRPYPLKIQRYRRIQASIQIQIY